MPSCHAQDPGSRAVLAVTHEVGVFPGASLAARVGSHLRCPFGLDIYPGMFTRPCIWQFIDLRLEGATT